MPGSASPSGLDLLRLGRCEILQHAPRDRGIDPECLHRRDDGIAPKIRAEPGHAGVRKGSLFGLGNEHVQVRHRAAEHLIEHVVRRFDARSARGKAAKLASCAPRRNEETAGKSDGPRFSLDAARNEEDRGSAARGELDPIARTDPVETCGLRIEIDDGAPHDVVKSAIDEGCAILRNLDAPFATARAAPTAHLEYVGEIGVEDDFEIDPEIGGGEVAQA